jgi:hypothetical protein
MAIILPHGVLFRGGAEERIRVKPLTDGHTDTIIGLPANLFYSTGIPVCVLVLKKCKKPDDVLFVADMPLMSVSIGRLFDSDRFGQIARLVDVGATQNCAVIGEQLQRHRVNSGRLEVANVLGHRDHGDAFGGLDA